MNMGTIAASEKTHLESPLCVSVDQIERIDGRPSDFLDPHWAALEENPDHAERPSARTILAVLVCASMDQSQPLLNEISAWRYLMSVQLRVGSHWQSLSLRR